MVAISASVHPAMIVRLAAGYDGKTFTPCLEDATLRHRSCPTTGSRQFLHCRNAASRCTKSSGNRLLVKSLSQASPPAAYVLQTATLQPRCPDKADKFPPSSLPPSLPSSTGVSEGSGHVTRQCPLWVKSGHERRTSQCPLCANSGHKLPSAIFIAFYRGPGRNNCRAVSQQRFQL